MKFAQRAVPASAAPLHLAERVAKLASMALPETAQLGRSRRLAESNRCKPPLAEGAISGERVRSWSAGLSAEKVGVEVQPMVQFVESLAVAIGVDDVAELIGESRRLLGIELKGDRPFGQLPVPKRPLAAPHGRSLTQTPGDASTPASASTHGARRRST